MFNCNDGEDDYYDHINASHELDNEYKYGDIIRQHPRQSRIIKGAKMNTKPNEVLIFKNQFPFGAVSSVAEAAKNHPSSADDNKSNDF